MIKLDCCNSRNKGDASEAKISSNSSTAANSFTVFLFLSVSSLKPNWNKGVATDNACVTLPFTTLRSSSSNTRSTANGSAGLQYLSTSFNTVSLSIFPATHKAILCRS